MHSQILQFCPRGGRRSRQGFKLFARRLSQATGLSFSTLHAAENQERGDMRLGTAFRLAHFYGLSSDASLKLTDCIPVAPRDEADPEKIAEFLRKLIF